MSYKTQTSKVFHQTFPQAPRKRRVQDFTAISVDDPRTQELQRTPPQQQQPPHMVNVVEKDSNPKLDELMARQVLSLFSDIID